MPKIAYRKKRFHRDSLDTIERIDTIIAEYQTKGYTLTLRQCYYQLVARGYIENSEKSYKNIASLLNDARLAGLIDWQAITDRTRNIRLFDAWDSPESIIRGAAESYQLDLWEGQPFYIETWVEKDALVDVVGQACSRTRTPFFSCRGFTSQSEMWAAAERFRQQIQREGRYILYLGDHDPSGLDMTRDIQDRLNMFGAGVTVERIALNMPQIQQYNPPPNPAKKTDARYKQYAAKYGRESWELDAMRPEVLEELIHESISRLLDKTAFNEVLEREEEQRQELFDIAENYGAIMDALNETT